MKNNFKGIIPPVTTIFDEYGNLDQLGMGNVIDFLIDSEVDGLLFGGSTGEFSQMSFNQRKEVATFCVNYVNHRIPVLIGTGSTSTNEAIQLSEHAEEIGADGVIVVNPYYWFLSEKNLIDHYSQIASSINLPMMLYNFPDRTGQDLSPDLVLKLIEHNANIVGIKDTVDKISHTSDMILRVKSQYPDFGVLSGYDDHLFNTLALGGDGGFPFSTHFAPSLTKNIFHAFKENDLDKAVKSHKKLACLSPMLQLDAPFINVIKEAIKLKGIDIPTHVLPPVNQIDEDSIEKLKVILNQASL